MRWIWVLYSRNNQRSQRWDRFVNLWRPNTIWAHLCAKSGGAIPPGPHGSYANAMSGLQTAAVIPFFSSILSNYSSVFWAERHRILFLHRWTFAFLLLFLHTFYCFVSLSDYVFWQSSVLCCWKHISWLDVALPLLQLHIVLIYGKVWVYRIAEVAFGTCQFEARLFILGLTSVVCHILSCFHRNAHECAWCMQDSTNE